MPACYLGSTRIYAVLDSRSQETKMTWLRGRARRPKLLAADRHLPGRGAGMTTLEPPRFACLVSLCVLDDPPVIEAMLQAHVLRAAERGEIELAEGWRLDGVHTEVRQSRFSSELVAWAIGTVLGA